MGKYCSRCKAEQAPEKQHVSYCNPCKQLRKKEARIESRKTRGLHPVGFFKIHCCDCEKPKEDERQTYCNPCRKKRDNARNLEKGHVVKPQTGLCPCGAERGANQPYYCLPCKAKNSMEWRKSQLSLPEAIKKANQRERDNKLKRAIAAFKRSVRRITEECVRKGLLIKQPCEKCNAIEKVEAHHDDYNKPTEVRWLCREHHLEHHRNEKELL